MADEKPAPKNARKKSSRRRAAAKKTGVRPSTAIKAGGGKAASKQRGAKASAKTVAGKKISARKPVPIKTARVGKRAVLPPLPPPPTAPLKSTRSPARRASRAKAMVRDTSVRKTGLAICEITACTEAALREKLRLAAPYIEIWMTRTEAAGAEQDAPTPEAAFVRIWQWLNLEVALEDGRTVTTALIDEFLAEERERHRQVGE